MTYAVLLAIAAFVFWRLDRSNMTVPAGVEEYRSARQALHFALDNDLPI